MKTALNVLEKAAIVSLRQDIGSNIRFKRETLHLSQEKLGFITGLNPAYLGRVERGQENISLDSIAKIARALEIELFTLFKKNSSPQSSIKDMLTSIRKDMDSLKTKTVITIGITERTEKILAESRIMINGTRKKKSA